MNNEEYVIKGKVITDKLLEKIRPQLKAHRDPFVFDGKLFAISNIDGIDVEPSGMPLFYREFFKGKIANWKTIAKEIFESPNFKITKTKDTEEVNRTLKNNTERQICFAKSRALYTGFLREVYSMFIAKDYDSKCVLQKDIKADLGEGGVDFGFTRSWDGLKVPFGIGHEGYIPPWRRAKKDAKRAINVRVIKAPNDKKDTGLHVITAEQFSAAIKRAEEYEARKDPLYKEGSEDDGILAEIDEMTI